MNLDADYLVQGSRSAATYLNLSGQDQGYTLDCQFIAAKATEYPTFKMLKVTIFSF